MKENRIRKYLLFLLCVLLPLAGAGISFSQSGREQRLEARQACRSFYVNMECGGSTQQIHPWKDDSGVYYLVLPSYASRCGALAFAEDTSYGMRILLDGREVSAYGQSSYKELKESYELTFRDAGGRILESARLEVLTSANLPAVFVWTGSGNMDTIHANKTNKEKGAIAVYKEDGTEDYAGMLNYIKGRGNVTWEERKKPYNLSLDRPEGLLGMEETADWALLSGAMDTSYIRNKLAFRLAQELGIADTSDASYVDLYLNGEYAGLYLLTEKADRDTAARQGEKYLLEIEMEERLEAEPYGFKTMAGQSVVIKSGGVLSEDKLRGIQNHVQRVEDAIYREDWDAVCSLLDLQSYTKVYLAEEILQNHDAYISSQYMYFYEQNGNYSKIYSGPVWDFDSSLTPKDGMFETELTAGQPRMGYPKYWIVKLVQNDHFQEMAREEYGSIAASYLNGEIFDEITLLQNRLKQAVEAECLRWHYQTPEQWEEQMLSLREYLEKRLDFLGRLWVEEEPFHTVRVEVGSDTFSALDYLVEEGGHAAGLPAHFTKKGYEFRGFYIRETGEEFTENTPVYGDLTVEAAWEKKERTVLTALRDTGILQMRYVLFGAITAGTILLLMIDRSIHRGGRSGPK